MGLLRACHIWVLCLTEWCLSKTIVANGRRGEPEEGEHESFRTFTDLGRSCNSQATLFIKMYFEKQSDAYILGIDVKYADVQSRESIHLSRRCQPLRTARLLMGKRWMWVRWMHDVVISQLRICALFQHISVLPIQKMQISRPAAEKRWKSIWFACCGRCWNLGLPTCWQGEKNSYQENTFMQLLTLLTCPVSSNRYISTYSASLPGTSR